MNNDEKKREVAKERERERKVKTKIKEDNLNNILRLLKKKKTISKGC